MQFVNGLILGKLKEEETSELDLVFRQHWMTLVEGSSKYCECVFMIRSTVAAQLGYGRMFFKP